MSTSIESSSSVDVLLIPMKVSRSKKKRSRRTGGPVWQHLVLHLPDPSPEQRALMRRTAPEVVALGLQQGVKTAVLQGHLPSPAAQPAPAIPWGGAFDADFIDRWLRGDPDVLRWVARAELNANKEAIERAGELLPYAMRHCRVFGIEAPWWLVCQFAEHHEHILVSGHKPMKRRTRRARDSHAALMRPVSLALAARLYANPDEDQDTAFEAVCEQLDIKRTKCREVYEESVRQGCYEWQALQRFLQAYRRERGSLLPAPAICADFLRGR